MKNKLKIIVPASLLAAGSAMAELPAGIGTGISSASADAIAVIALGGAALLTVSIAAVAWKVAMKFAKRASGAV